MRMKVLYDHQTFSIQEYGGISRYFIELLTGINRSKNNQAYLATAVSNNIHLHEAGFPVRSFFPKFNLPKKAALIYRINSQYSVKLIKKNQFDVFHATYYDPYFIPYLNGKPFIITIHDMIFEKFGNTYKELGQDTEIVESKRQLAQQAAAIIAVSQSTKRDVIDILGVEPRKVHVIYHGNSLLPIGLNTKQTVKPYLLYVGNRERYKNFDKLLQAIAPLLQQYNIALVCGGGGKFNLTEQALIRSIGIEAYVRQQPIDSDRILQCLYQSALAFVFPSLYEGFGIPILEAFACQCPCILSNTSSLPEVAGEAAVYFDPTCEDSIKQAVERVISDDDLRNQMKLVGNQRLVNFSWANAVHQTLAIYQSCLNPHDKK